jgi:hypothetical protein
MDNILYTVKKIEPTWKRIRKIIKSFVYVFHGNSFIGQGCVYFVWVIISTSPSIHTYLHHFSRFRHYTAEHIQT